ncbi:radical SAM protein [Thermoflavimicrobium daqui]|uniref:Radical SAM protein n=1 Tax=Thermoflavimicrobium daqui TaxID=2137476 RepID=A0A364K153_9BACL|nr:radical SAM protein [Thermoflavimicrobium daqui]RAL21417.1 radical SAM protein [Thermoflavimicrobium daqui]
MQPKTSVKFDQKTFNNIKRTIKNMSVAGRAQLQDPTYAVDIPEDIGIKLNNGCNLRCKHCFEWNSDGYHHEMDKSVKNGEIDFTVFEQIMEQTREKKSRLYLWGGEPLFYSQFDQLAELLAKDPRETTICTNAILIEQKLDAILKMSDQLTLLVSLEGFEQENDAIRGKGTFRRVVKAVERLRDLQEKGIYKGRVSISLTINDAMIGKLYDFMVFFEEIGVDTVYFVFPWYIPEAVANTMDDFFMEQFPWLAKQISAQKYSWHSFTFHISPAKVEPLIEEMERMNQRIWQSRIRFQPALEPDEVRDFVLGVPKPAMKRTQCLSIASRVDIMPDGKVNPCKFFPEFTLGDLTQKNVTEVFHSDNFKKHREVLGCGLMPICSRCVLLYNHGR